MGVLTVGSTLRAIGQGARVGLADGVIFVVGPLGGSGNVGEQGAAFAVGVDLGPVCDDQALIRPDRAGRLEQGQAELAAGVAEQIVGVQDQRATRERDAGHLRCQIAHPAIERVRWLARQPIDDIDVPGVARPGPAIPDVDGELRPLPEVNHRGRARLRDHEIGLDDRHRLRVPPLAREGFIEHAIDQSPELPLGGVGELRPCHVRRRVIEDDRDLDHDLVSGRDIGKIELEVLITPHVLVCAQQCFSGAAHKVDAVALIGEIRARRSEIVPDSD